MPTNKSRRNTWYLLAAAALSLVAAGVAYKIFGNKNINEEVPSDLENKVDTTPVNTGVEKQVYPVVKSGFQSPPKTHEANIEDRVGSCPETASSEPETYTKYGTDEGGYPCARRYFGEQLTHETIWRAETTIKRTYHNGLLHSEEKKVDNGEYNLTTYDEQKRPIHSLTIFESENNASQQITTWKYPIEGGEIMRTEVYTPDDLPLIKEIHEDDKRRLTKCIEEDGMENKDTYDFLYNSDGTISVLHNGGPSDIDPHGLISRCMR
ncbi:MAG: hypothetical protein ABIJ08_07320 [Nanoarchaeota archaeon]